MENHKENKWMAETYPLPISVIKDGKYWVATFNDETRKLLGESLNGLAQGETKEDAIKTMFLTSKILVELYHERMLSYERWVPFIKGNWGTIGGNWVCIFGIHISFRYGKNMKYGWYIPFTKLNINITSYWKAYRNFLKRKEEERNLKLSGERLGKKAQSSHQ